MLPTRSRNQTFLIAALVSVATVVSSLAVAGTTQAKEVRATPVEVPSGWTWTNYGPELMSVSCVTPNNCVAVGQGGAVLRSPNTDDVPLAWTFVNLKKDPDAPEDPVDLVAVSCSTSSCIAVSSPLTPTVTSGSWVYRSTDGGATWTTVQQLPLVGATRKTNLGSAIACEKDLDATAANRVCYIAGITGGIWRSENDGQSWTGLPLPKDAPATASFDKVACATADFCVAAGGDDTPSSVLIRVDKVSPLATPVGIDKRFAALACDGAVSCVASGGVGNYTVMAVDATPKWGPAHAFRKNPKEAAKTVKALSCPVANICIGLDGDGFVLRTDALDNPNLKWAMRPAPAIIGTLDCFTVSCVGVGKSAAWYASFDLGSGFERINEVAKFDVAVCSTALDSACIAGGDQNVGRSITGGTLWTLPVADRGALNTKAITCSSSLACTIFGQTAAMSTNDMDAFSPRWGPVQSAAGVDAVDCVTNTLCVAASESVAYTTFDAGKTQWTTNQLPKVRPAGISCIAGRTDPVTCFIAVKTNILIGTMRQDPDTGLPHWLWRYTNADPDEELVAIDCSPDGLQCAAAGKQGEILTTLGGNLLDWSQQTIPPNVPVDELPDYTSVNCPKPGFCLVGGKHGAVSVVTSTIDYFSTYSYDEIGDLRAAVGVSGFGCESINRCIAVGSTVLLGIRNPPIPVPAQ